MLENKGMGLAANQIGITKRFFAIGDETFDKFKKSAIIWNPRLITQSEEKVSDSDERMSCGCVVVSLSSSPLLFISYVECKRPVRSS